MAAIIGLRLFQLNPKASNGDILRTLLVLKLRYVEWLDSIVCDPEVLPGYTVSTLVCHVGASSASPR